jgi:hypothetical protein
MKGMVRVSAALANKTKFPISSSPYKVSGASIKPSTNRLTQKAKGRAM